MVVRKCCRAKTSLVRNLDMGILKSICRRIFNITRQTYIQRTTNIHLKYDTQTHTYAYTRKQCSYIQFSHQICRVVCHFLLNSASFRRHLNNRFITGSHPTTHLHILIHLCSIYEQLQGLLIHIHTQNICKGNDFVVSAFSFNTQQFQFIYIIQHAT